MTVFDTPSRLPDEPPTPLVLRQAIDTAIQAVLGRVYARQGLGRCATYAIVGAQVLSKLLDHPYHAVCGGQVLDCGGGLYLVLYPVRQARRHARNLGDMTEYHCWIESQRLVPGMVAPRTEVVDFTARHDAASAALFNVPFTRYPAPDYIWTWADVMNRQFPDSLRAHPQLAGRKPQWMWVDAQCTRWLGEMEKAQPGYYAKLVDAVIAALTPLLEPLVTVAPQSAATAAEPISPEAEIPSRV